MSSSVKLFGFVFVCLFVSSYAFNAHEFKKCQDIDFCKENRARAEETQPSIGFHVIPESVKSEAKTLSGLIANPLEEGVRFTFTLQILQNPQNTVRFKIDEEKPESKRFEPPYVLQDQDIQYGDISVTQSSEAAVVTSGDNRAVLTFNPLKVEFYKGENLVVIANDRKLFHFDHYKPKPEDPKVWQQSFKSFVDTRPKGPASISMDFTFVGASHVYGIPEHATDFALKPTRGPSGYSEPYRLYNLDVFEYDLDSPFGLYGTIPLMFGHSKKGTSAVFLLNTSEMYVDVSPPTPHSTSTEMSTQTHWYAETGLLDIFVFLGPSPSDIMEQYTTLTGRASLPPLFSLSYNQCRWNYKDETDVQMVDKQFDTHNIPCDLIWLDIEHTDGKKYFTWDSKLFPTPQKMIQNLSVKGRKMVTIVDPHIKRDDSYPLHQKATRDNLYVKTIDGRDFEGKCWPGQSSYMDFLNPKAREAYAEEYVNYEGATDTLHTWNDMNEPSVFDGPEITMQKDLLHDDGKVEHRDIHNAYGLLHHMASHEGLRKRLGQKRPFILTRSFFPGSQRFAGVWTGDNFARWDHLKAAQPMLLSLGISGIPHVGSDVGGFFGNPEPELLVRWYQAGAYHPFFRAHAHIDTKRREPWLFGEPTTSIIREAIRSRYRLLPYWYTIARQSNTTGVPMMRPLFFQFPKDESVFAMQDQFLLGSDVLVKPVTEPSADKLTVYFPSGEDGKQIWYDLDDGTVIKNHGDVTVSAPLSRLPVFQRGGSIIPKRERPRRSSLLMLRDPFTLVVGLDSQGNASGELYLDDGETYNFQNGEFLHRKFTFENNKLSSKSITSVGNYPLTQEVVVERVIIRGLSKVPTKITKTQDGNTEALSFSVDEKSQLIIRRPWTTIGKDWEISLEF